MAKAMTIKYQKSKSEKKKLQIFSRFNCIYIQAANNKLVCIYLTKQRGNEVERFKIISLCSQDVCTMLIDEFNQLKYSILLYYIINYMSYLQSVKSKENRDTILISKVIYVNKKRVRENWIIDISLYSLQKLLEENLSIQYLFVCNKFAYHPFRQIITNTRRKYFKNRIA
ncbi:hypothetical protein pb186bvf_007808 [Paramecium bursaria]